MSATSTPRSPRFDLPPAPAFSNSTATDTGLAEWTSKIKAMQRQVDADDEAEKRRLEEEIVRARLARVRRSRTGQSGDFGIGMHGVNLSKLQEDLPRTVEADPGTSSERPSTSAVSLAKPPVKPTLAGGKPAPISLAAFMGGSASGPRLRRHEPQLDASLAYDGREDHGLIHPIFGRGGVAIPGMVTGAVPPSLSAPTSVPQLSPLSNPIPSAPQTISSELSRTRTTSTSNIARRYVEKIEEQASNRFSSPKESSLGIRERRQSTPQDSLSELKVTPTPAFLSHPLPQNFGGGSAFPARSPTMEPRPKTPAAPEACPKSLVTDYQSKPGPVAIEARSKTASPDFPIKFSLDELRAKTPDTDTARVKTSIKSSTIHASFPGAISRQIHRHQPYPQLPSTSTIFSRSPAPPSPVRGTHAPQPQRGISPTLLRPPISSSTKDPTPSISRLQGRGFVQSIVQASDRLSGDLQGSPSAAPKHVFPSTSPAPCQGGNEAREKGARRASVLDRWTPMMNANRNSTPSPPLQTTKSATPTRSRTAHVSMKSGQGQDVSVIATHDTGRSVRSVASLPAIPRTPLKKSDGMPVQDMEEKLGSSSTMISYVKPVMTGDDPVTPDVDELGVRASEGGVQVGGAGTRTGGSGTAAGITAFPGKEKTPRVSASPLASSLGKPLSHPTKDRAKKPRKAKFEEGRSEEVSVASRPSGGSSATGTESVGQTPNLAVSSSTGPVASTSDTSNAPASFRPGDLLPGAELPANISLTSVGEVTGRWMEPTLIEVKPTLSASAADTSTSGAKPAGAAGAVGRRALPGLANLVSVATMEKYETPASVDKEERTTVPPSPTRHTRIPSTGNRALVMEVAQALSEAAQQQEKESEIMTVPALAPSASVFACQLPSTGFGGPATEKRKSSYERYSAIAMPPLAEERTPAVSPASTMSRGAGKKTLGDKAVGSSPLSSLRTESASTAEQASSGPSLSPSLKVHIAEDQSLSLLRRSKLMRIDRVDEPLPKPDVAALLKVERPVEFMPNPDLRMISVEVIAVVHTSAIPVQRNTNIFYDAEVLVIVHRAKSRESGLVVTKVWCWKGKKCHFGEKEERKVGELARRYSTSADVVYQQREPAELVYVLGGQLAIRQGTRAHWSSENTAMHVVRSNDGHILIDEIDLNIRNLCSGYSYCISVLDNIYVWHGCGSVAVERTAALLYAQGMAAKGTLVKEFVEGENDGGDEMFWMVIGDSESYAKADYWRWRSSAVKEKSDPRCWLVDIANLEAPIRPVPTVIAETVQQESVYIIDCFWEFFVLIGKDARAKRADITLALDTATAMAPLVATSKPFSPTVHVLILPTQLPLDMRHAFRNLDELTLNGGFIPDHMNILSTVEAAKHLRTSSWDRSVLRDHTMLPLGLDSSHVPLP